MADDAFEALAYAFNEHEFDDDPIAAVRDRLASRGYHLASEGQAVVEGRVVELEREAWLDDRGHLSSPKTQPFGKHSVALYRVKPERSDRRVLRPCDCEDAWCPHTHTNDEPAEVVHACPPGDSGTMPCCGRTPFERLADRMTLDPALVTCTGGRHTEGEGS